MIGKFTLLVASILFVHGPLKAAEVSDLEHSKTLNIGKHNPLKSMTDFSRASSVRTVFFWKHIEPGDFRIIREKFTGVEEVHVHGKGCKSLSSWIRDLVGWETLKTMVFQGKINYETQKAITEFTPDALKELNAVLKTLPRLNALGFMSSDLIPSMISHLAEGVASITALEGLSFIHSPIGEAGLRMILENASTTLKSLTFINSGFTDLEMDTIIEITRLRPALQYFIIEKDTFSSDSLKRLARALLANERLEILSLNPKETDPWRKDVLEILRTHPNAKSLTVYLLGLQSLETLSSEEEEELKAYEEAFKELRLKSPVPLD